MKLIVEILRILLTGRTTAESPVVDFSGQGRDKYGK